MTSAAFSPTPDDGVGLDRAAVAEDDVVRLNLLDPDAEVQGNAFLFHSLRRVRVGFGRERSKQDVPRSTMCTLAASARCSYRIGEHAGSGPQRAPPPTRRRWRRRPDHEVQRALLDQAPAAQSPRRARRGCASGAARRRSTSTWGTCVQSPRVCRRSSAALRPRARGSRPRRSYRPQLSPTAPRGLSRSPRCDEPRRFCHAEIACSGRAMSYAATCAVATWYSKGWNWW